MEYSPLLSTFRVCVSLFLSVITIATSTFEMPGSSKSWAPCVLASFLKDSSGDSTSQCSLGLLFGRVDLVLKYECMQDTIDTYCLLLYRSLPR